MDISKVNLNLLIVLDALLKEENITHAGQKVCLSQPAVSSCLNQLREIFQDKLLVRAGRNMVLTSKAEHLKPHVDQLVQELNALLHYEKCFDPAKSEQTFTIAISDYIELILIPILLKKIGMVAPQVKLRTVACDLFADKKYFEEEKIDVGIGMMRYYSPEITAEKLYTESFIYLADIKNPLLKEPLTLERYLKAGHVARMLDNERKFSITQDFLDKKGMPRNNICLISHTLTSLYSIQGTDLITTTVHTVGQYLKTNNTLNLVGQPVPFAIPPEPVYLLWHRENHQDAANLWLRNTIRSCVFEMTGGCQ